MDCLSSLPKLVLIMMAELFEKPFAADLVPSAPLPSVSCHGHDILSSSKDPSGQAS